MIDTLNLQTGREVSVTVAAVDGQERLIIMASGGANIQCRLEHNVLTVTDGTAEPVWWDFTNLLAVVAIAVTLYTEPNVVLAIFLVMPAILYLIRQALTRLAKQPCDLWQYAVPCMLSRVDLGRHGTLVMPRDLFAFSVSISSSGGSMRFGPWSPPPSPSTDGGPLRSFAFHLSGDGVIDGQGSAIDRLCVVTGLGRGSLTGVHVARELALTCRSGLHVGESGQTTAANSAYAVALTHSEECRVCTTGSTSLKSVRLNGRTPDQKGDIFVEHLLMPK